MLQHFELVRLPQLSLENLGHLCNLSELNQVFTFSGHARKAKFESIPAMNHGVQQTS